jgi:hypothetical protein
VIPTATTTGSILRVAASTTRDPWDPRPEPTVAASGIRSHIHQPGLREVLTQGQQATTTVKLIADPCDLRSTDQWLDEPSGVVWDVTGVMSRVGFGLDHVVADLTMTTGQA